MQIPIFKTDASLKLFHRLNISFSSSRTMHNNETNLFDSLEFLCNFHFKMNNAYWMLQIVQHNFRIISSCVNVGLFIAGLLFVPNLLVFHNERELFDYGLKIKPFSIN